MKFLKPDSYSDEALNGRNVRRIKPDKRREKKLERMRAKQERIQRSMPPRSSRTRRYAEENPDITPPTAAELAAALSAEAALRAGVEISPALTSEDSIHFRPPRRVHLGLLINVIMLLCFGLIMLFSASMTSGFADYANSFYWVLRQLFFSFMAILAMFFLTRVNPKNWNYPAIALIVYLVTTVLLILVLIPGIGQEVNDQRRWLPLVILPDTQFQPSEIAKLATVYCGAVYYSTLRKQRTQGKLLAKTKTRQVFKDLLYDFFLPGGLIFIWCALISQQSHWSSVVIISLILFVVCLGAGIRPRSWALMIGLVLALMLALSSLFMAFKPQITSYAESNPRLQHILVRLNVFSGGESVDEDASYQSRHALIGIGSGGWTGVGLGLGRQKFNWLPEIHNDYVFSNVCEELGFAGGVLVILLFMSFFILGINVTLKTQSIYMQILAAGFSSLIAIQAFLSIAVNLMVIPPTGISLPLFSYGGTSNIFFMVGIGFLLSVSKFGPKEQGGVPLANKKRKRANVFTRSARV